MQHKRAIIAICAAALLLDAAAWASSSSAPIRLLAPAASASEAVDAVAAALKAGDPARAERLANLALDRGDMPSSGRLHVLLNRGLALDQLGKRDAALADFTAALSDPALPGAARARALFDRGVVHDERADPDKAIADYTAALRHEPHFAAALNNRGNAYRRLGRLRAARRDYEASLAARNTNPQFPNYGLGQIAEAQGNPLAAQDYYRKALSADPHYAPASQRLAALSLNLPQASFVLRPPRPRALLHRVSTDDTAILPSGPMTPASYHPADDVPALRPAILGAPHANDRIQLGAYRAEADAAEGWNRLVVEAKGLLGGLTPQIVSVDLPGRGRFYRLRAGPLDRADAATLCTRLKARDLPCLPVRP